MAETSLIEWTDATWNPVTGCTKVGPGCLNCYMFRDWPRLHGMGVKGYEGAPDQVALHPERLEQPRRWHTSKRVFTCSMGDLFHSAVPWEFIVQVFNTMAVTPQHTYQVLTKRPGRMAYFAEHIWPNAGLEWEAVGPISCANCGEPYGAHNVNRKHFYVRGDWPGTAWPSNVWAGTSIEQEWDGQRHLVRRLDLLARVPAEVRFVSYEPALGPVDFRKWLPGWCSSGTTFESPRGTERYDIDGSPVYPIDWIIAGGESGPDARPAHPDWFRSVRDQCQEAGVPFFFKQWGEWTDRYTISGSLPSGTSKWIDPKGQFVDWQHDDVPLGSTMVAKVGKKAAGALLDGREYRQFPEVVNA